MVFWIMRVRRALFSGIEASGSLRGIPCHRGHRLRLLQQVTKKFWQPERATESGKRETCTVAAWRSIEEGGVIGRSVAC